MCKKSYAPMSVEISCANWEVFPTLPQHNYDVTSLVFCGSFVSDINVAFRQAMIKVAMDHEELAKQFELTLSLPPVQSSGVKSEMTNSWKYVGMSHKVSWPLHVVLTPATLEK